MARYLVDLRKTVTWEVWVDADSEADAIEKTKDWGVDDLKDEEIIDVSWDTTVYQTGVTV